MRLGLRLPLSVPLPLSVRPAMRAARAPLALRAYSDAPETSRAEKTMSRFWKEVTLAYQPATADAADAFVVQLDKRSVRTPGGQVLRVPWNRPLLACLVAQEWNEQTQVVKPHSLPMTSLAARAIDGLADRESRGTVEALLLRYFDTDAVCFHEAEPELLAELQRERWDPLIAWAEETYGIAIARTAGLFPQAQEPAARTRLTHELMTLDAFDLAAFERAVMTSKSFVIALALQRRFINAEQAALAAEVEVATQVHSWGAVEDSHDVDHADLRRQLASAACAMSKTPREAVDRFVAVLERRAGRL